MLYSGSGKSNHKANVVGFAFTHDNREYSIIDQYLWDKLSIEFQERENSIAKSMVLHRIQDG